ncbi:hypothetical protein U1Q18_009538 [Sarracenia purpurea var. burkii]
MVPQPSIPGDNSETPPAFGFVSMPLFSATSRRPSPPQTTAPARTQSDTPPSSVVSLLGHEHQCCRSSRPA